MPGFDCLCPLWGDRMAKLLVVLALMFVGAAIGIWLGFYVLFVGGLTDLYSAWVSDETKFSQVLVGVAKLALAGPVGHYGGLLAMLPGSYLLKRWVL